MEVVTGVLPSLLRKLTDLLIGQYNLRRRVKGEIIFLHAELESMQGALEKVSSTPASQLDIQDRIWARDLRELSYDIEDSIDMFMVRSKGSEPAELHGIKRFIDRSVGLFREYKTRQKIATEIRSIKSRVEEVSKRRDRYKVGNCVTVDPQLFGPYEKAAKLVGIDEATNEIIRIFIESDKMSQQQDKVVSILGIGGLGKTTLANAVYEKLRGEFGYSAFVSVSQTPDMDKLLKDLLYQLAEKISARVNIIDELREFLKNKRYFIILDDIWDISIWEMIRCALPHNNVGNRIIITTRIFNVAEHAGGAYNLKPLSLSNSRKLFYRRVFGNDSEVNNQERAKCSDEDLAEVSERILKKCAGVPLAVVTMASLLACKGRNKIEWYEVYNSIGTGLENNLNVDNMRKILPFSYYDLPFHLRTCLLYLSVFPEDSEIDKDRLIWMWIAEGFIQCERQDKSIFGLGEGYFNELINRSMIQHIHSGYTGTLEQCHVHDMVLDLICSLCHEENFVAIFDDTNCTSPSNTIRRLTLQNGRESHATTLPSRSLKQVRSVIVLPRVIDLMPALESFQVLRVLELKGCDLSQSYSIKYLENLLHLRYLGLRDTGIAELPEEIGNMQFLQTLDVKGNAISCLPSTFVQLRNLMCLQIDHSTRVPNGIGKLTCLEELSNFGIDDSSNDIIEELGQLTELRVLGIVFNESNSKLVEALQKLQKIKNLSVEAIFCQRKIGGLDAWVAPRHLCRLITQWGCWFSRLPTWMSPSLLPDLSVLSMALRELQQDDLEVLGRLPALRCLQLEVQHENLSSPGSFVIGPCLFSCLVYWEFRGFVWPIIFQQGAMPRLTKLCFCHFYVRDVRDDASRVGYLDMGLGNLPSLQEVVLDFQSEGVCEELEQAKDAMRHVAEVHPNQPYFNII